MAKLSQGELESPSTSQPWLRRRSKIGKRGLGMAKGVSKICLKFKAHRIRFEFHKGAADHTYMRIDGEPWKQPLPIDDDTVMVEISHHGQVNMLATHDCRSKSLHHDPSLPSHHSEEDDSDEEDSTQDPEYMKFGAADTFKIPDEIDISHLS
ncbi:hypothetical protein SLEP1_g9810 [Rubroshorea leprosula]|uniref:Diacylglycerol kinase n=1 Tax=Rubroshorea leprosula TaxID=152421 RepID=A0AAV5IE11_9ROSI|nr:hypothetical protein SLEP1_g9810 [Rubroshorea leprosula]